MKENKNTTNLCFTILNNRPLSPTLLQHILRDFDIEKHRNKSKFLQIWGLSRKIIDKIGLCLFVTTQSGMQTGSHKKKVTRRVVLLS